MSFKVPILFLVFNRPQTTIKVFEKIREIKPSFLYVAADGPRRDKLGEKEICEEVRNIVLSNVDWECEVKTLFRDDNLGCGKAPAEAITWFFQNVEQGIILEDDVLPAVTFFKFCEELLDKYKDNAKIMSIGGSNFTGSLNEGFNESYIFSEYPGNWGWASWRRAWKGYDYNIVAWDLELVKKRFRNRFSKEQYLFFNDIFSVVCNNNVDDIWDYQWWFHRLLNEGIGITPTVNLTKNIGFNAQATHTFIADKEIEHAKLENISFPLVHPIIQLINKKYDYLLAMKYYWKNEPKKVSLFRRAFNKIFRK